jgi:AraC family transcriptional regulator of adaptative response/methylated-DNA-[protein]-cysteine methyltransferase
MDRDYARVAAAIRFINQHYRQQPGLEEVAAHMHLSPGHAQRVFSRWAGITPKQFLQFLTVQHAKTLLAGNASLLASSHQLGLSGSGRLHDHFITLEAMTPQQSRTGGRDLALDYSLGETPFGQALVVATARGGICHLAFVDSSPAAALLEAQRRWPAATWKEQPNVTSELLSSLFAPDAGGYPITLQLNASNFRLQVWQALLRIPEGGLVSYQQLAQLAGKPAAVRAVASAVAANPVAWLIPCHRVIRASGECGQYRWGSERKQAMLAWEQGPHGQNSR